MPRSQEGLARLIEHEARVSRRVVAAFRSVAREQFVPAGQRGAAYRDRPVEIPEGQTTSQPSLIAYMIDAIRPEPHHRVLEIGTGYGFQTALLAQLVENVISVERHAPLAAHARDNLKQADVTNAEVIVGDGWKGCPAKAPFDGIVVSAAATSFPAALGEQLKEGGHIVIPISSDGVDDVYLFEKREGQVIKTRLVTPARFVPLVPDLPQ